MSKQYYDITCPICNHQFAAARSIAQTDFALYELGHGSCPGCNTFLNLTYDPETDSMSARDWNVWLSGKKGDLVDQS